MSSARAGLLSCLILLCAGGIVLAAQPVITGVSIPDVSMKIGDVVTATINVQSDVAVFTMNASNIGGYVLSGLSKQNDTTYTAQFTINSGGTDYVAGVDIPTSVELEDSGLTDTWSTAISQANDPIDANRPTVTAIDLADADPTNNNSVDFTVTFSENVTDIEIDDFALAVTGTASGLIDSVSAASGTTVTVTVDTVAGDGTLGLNFDYDAQDSVVDEAGNPAAADFTGETYSIDNTPPSVPIGLDPADASYTNDTSPLLSWTASTDNPGGSGIRDTNAYRIVITGPANRDTYVSDTDYNPTLGLDGTYTWKVYARDNAGNRSAYTADHTFTIDTENPTVSSITRDDPNPTNGSQVYMQVDFSEDVTGVATGNFSIDATVGGQDGASVNSVGLIGGSSWWVLLDTEDDAEGTLSIDLNLNLSGITDNADNPLLVAYTTGEAYDVDRLDPQVSSVVVDTDPMYEGDLVQQVTVTFNEAMDPGDDPVISFGAGTLGSNSDGAWSDGNTIWTETFTLTDNDEEIAIVTVDVTGANDAIGNDQAAYAETDEFDIDTVKPSVSTVEVDTDPMYEGDLIQQVTVTFDEAMDAGTDPTISFGAGTFASNSDGAWTDGNTVWTETFTLTDNNEDITAVTVGVAAAKDAAGNDQETYTAQIEFDIDTVKPTVLTVVVDTDPMYESDLIQQVVVTFDESMENSTDPSITFGAGTFASNSDGGWTVGNTVWTETFTLTDNNEEIDVVSIDVTGAKDAAGNPQEDRTILDAFNIDTVKPTVTDISTNDALITDADTPGDGTFVVTIEFSEDMNTGVAPVVSFSPTIASTLTLDGSSAWLDSDTYEAKYDTADGNVDHENVQIDAAGAQDAAGNLQEDYTPEDEFGIDTVNPTVTAVAVDDTLLSDSDAGTTLTVAVNFSESMTDDGSADPTLTFNPSVASTLAFASDSWPTSTRYEAVYDISDAGVDEDWGVTIDVTLADDENGNPQQDYTPEEEFEIDTLNPTVTSLLISDNLITDADVGDTFTVTIDYSEPMLGTAPSITFSPALTTTLSLQSGNTGWTDADTYVFSYTILDGNVTVLDDDITITNAQDLAGNVQVGYNYDDQLDVDTENPYFHDFSVIGGAVDDNCFLTVTFTAKVTDPNGTMVSGDITVTAASVTNTAAGITAGDVYDVVQTSDSQTTITISGKVDIQSLTGCPATVMITLDAVDSVDNNAVQQSQSDDVVDTIIPVINDLRFDTDATHTAEQVVPYLVDECGVVTVYFSGNVTDNCCIVPANVNVAASLPMLVGEGPAILEDFEYTPVQNGQGQVDFTGSAVVRCPESCPLSVCLSRVQIDVTASDCCGNVAVPDATGTGEGLVDDEILPIPRDDPRQDMVLDESAIIDPLVEVRLDEYGTYRLVLRESTPVRIDIMADDADNVTHNAAHPFSPCVECGPCGGQTGCCATMYIEDIVKQPSYGTATIEDDEGNCNGGTVIRYAPDRGYLGPDYFTYRIRDAFSNVSSVIATVYLQVVPEVWMEDVFVIACSNESTEFTVSASDLFIDADDPTTIPFDFALLDGPEHGVITGDLLDVAYTPPSTITDPQFGVQVPSLDFTEAASVTLHYTSARGYTGRDFARVQFEDPFGGAAESVVDITVRDCRATGPPVVYVAQGDLLPFITPISFASVEEANLVGVTLTAESDGTTYAVLTAVWSEDLNRHMLILDTSGLPIGAYELRIPLGNGETVVMTIEVGEGE